MTLEKRKEKEQKELTRLRKINQKPQTAKYIKWIFVLVILVHVIDEIASNCAAYVQSSVVNDFFVVGQGMTYENGLAHEHGKLHAVSHFPSFICFPEETVSSIINFAIINVSVIISPVYLSALAVCEQSLIHKCIKIYKIWISSKCRK